MPCDYRRYHPEWKSISRQIKEQADNCCEWCGLRNGIEGFRDRDGRFEEVVGSGDAQCHDGMRPVRIVLTVAHLDHDITNNDPANLKALCQRCHNRHDMPMRQRNAAKTRRRKREANGQAVLL